jgi:hypothetical protein
MHVSVPGKNMAENMSAIPGVITAFQSYFLHLDEITWDISV